MAINRGVQTQSRDDWPRVDLRVHRCVHRRKRLAVNSATLFRARTPTIRVNKLRSPGNPYPGRDPRIETSSSFPPFRSTPPWTSEYIPSAVLLPLVPGSRSRRCSSTWISDSADVYVCCGWCSDTELLEESYSLYGVKPPGRPSSGPPRSPFPPGAQPPLPPGGQGYDATRYYCTHVSHTLCRLRVCLA